MSRVVTHLKGKLWVYAFVSGVVVGLCFCLFTEIRNFSFDTSTGSLSVSMRDQNDLENFRLVWGDEDRREIHMALLAREGVYTTGDPRIVDAITNLCDPIPSEPLAAYLSAARDCAEKPVPKLLRELAQQEKPPFHPAGSVVSIGVPDKADQPPAGRANTCLNGVWYRRRVLLTNPLNGRQVIVHATGHYGQGICGPVVGAADFQINEEDAFSIFDGPINKFEKVVAVIIN